jgi:hypothetical protein
MRSRILGILPFVIIATALNAQNTSGSLHGTVQDSAKARVSAATFEVKLSGSSQTRRATSDSQGEFRIEDLTPGSWHVSVYAPSFANATADVSVAVSTTRDITVTLQPSILQQAVGVRAQSSSISTQPIDLSSNVHSG